MHTYKIEVFLNDINGNPTKGLVTTQYCDNADKAEALYNQYHDPFQVGEETGEKLTVRVYTVRVNVLCYKRIASPTDFFAQFHA